MDDRRGRQLQIVAPGQFPPRKSGCRVVSWNYLVSEFIEPAKQSVTERETLENPAQPLFAWLDKNHKIGVTEIPVLPGDLSLLYGYLIEPCYRRDINLTLSFNGDIWAHLHASDQDRGLSWTPFRLRYLLDNYERQIQSDQLPPMTPIEMRLFEALQKKRIPAEPQFRVGRYTLDFALPSLGIAIEADGRGWHDSVRDRQRDEELRVHGWHTVRFSGSEIYWDAAGCADVVAAAVTKRSTGSPLIATTPNGGWIDERSWWRKLVDWFRHRSRRAGMASQTMQASGAKKSELSQQQFGTPLDKDQLDAVWAGDGVVQILAPAGSGKTMTLVGRTAELIARGVPKNRILITTFNRAATDEISERLSRDGISGVDVRNFHGIGRLILKEAGRLRPNIGQPTYGQLRRIATQVAQQPEREFIDAPEVVDAISTYKLLHQVSPDLARQMAATPFERSAADIYAHYEAEQAAADRYDFDDLILRPVQLLKNDFKIRSYWQRKWQSILVDEFQDIEPAQLQLVQQLAAPEDSVFAVGDEDQCIYAWRRADVGNIVNLDQMYPGLERHVLSTTYRCPSSIASASRRLIEHNKQRFPKSISPAPNRPPGEARALLEPSMGDGAARVIELIKDIDPDDVVVLARSSRLLTHVVGKAVEEGVAVRAPQRALRLTDSEEVVAAYLRLALNPGAATPSDIALVCRRPNSYLPQDEAQPVAAAIRDIGNFEPVIAERFKDSDSWRRDALVGWAQLCDELMAVKEFVQFLEMVRSRGGLDRYYASAEKMSNIDKVDIDALDELGARYSDETCHDVLHLLEQKKILLASAEDPQGPAVELTTIHGAKGREWETVILFGADDDQMPHKRALMETDDGPAGLLSAIEDERRLAYVAMTRASSRLLVVASENAPSRFITEAGLGTVSAT